MALIPYFGRRILAEYIQLGAGYNRDDCQVALRGCVSPASLLAVASDLALLACSRQRPGPPCLPVTAVSIHRVAVAVPSRPLPTLAPSPSALCVPRRGGQGGPAPRSYCRTKNLERISTPSGSNIFVRQYQGPTVRPVAGWVAHFRNSAFSASTSRRFHPSDVSSGHVRWRRVRRDEVLPGTRQDRRTVPEQPSGE